MMSFSQDISIRLRLPNQGYYLNVSESLFREYLPNLYRNYNNIRHDRSSYYDLTDFIDPIYRNVGDLHVSQTIISTTLEALLSHLTIGPQAVNTTHPDSRTGLDSQLIRFFESSLYHDTATRNRQSRRSLPQFAVLTEIANQCSSPRLQSMMYSFFLSHCAELAASESAEMLIAWASCVLRSGMPQCNADQCVLEILRWRPEFSNEVRSEAAAIGNWSSRTREVWVAINRVNGTSGIGRRPRASNHRQSTPQGIVPWRCGIFPRGMLCHRPTDTSRTPGNSHRDRDHRHSYRGGSGIRSGPARGERPSPGVLDTSSLSRTLHPSWMTHRLGCTCGHAINDRLVDLASNAVGAVQRATRVNQMLIDDRQHERQCEQDQMERLMGDLNVGHCECGW